MSREFDDLNLEQVELLISVYEEYIKDSKRLSEQLREAGCEEGLIRFYEPRPELYTRLEMLDDRLKELKEKNAPA